MSYLLAGALPNISPDINGLPGPSSMQPLMGGFAMAALMASGVGLLIGAIVWAVASHSSHAHHAHTGRMAVVHSAIAALISGGAVGIINFAFGAGSKFH